MAFKPQNLAARAKKAGTDIANQTANQLAADIKNSANISVDGIASAVEGTMLNSNVADGTTIEVSSNTLSTLKVPNVLTAGSGLSAGGTFDGAAARRFTVDSGSLVAYYSGSTFAQVGGDITISSTGTHTITGKNISTTSNTLLLQSQSGSTPNSLKINSVTVEEVNTGLQGYWKMGDGTNDEYPVIYDQTNPTLSDEKVVDGNFPTPNNNWSLTLFTIAMAKLQS